MTLFGVGVSPSAEPGRDPVAFCRRAEELGFDFVSTSDHPCGASPTWESWTMLAWVAASTSRIRVATRVLGLPYRAPAMVAKMAETFDRLSGGRLILGLGGGSADHEFRAFGLATRSAREKVDGLAEAVEVIRGLWTRPAFTHTGGQFHTDAAELEPKPDRAIPIWLGTHGPRALGVTGRLADGWFPALASTPPERVPRLRESLHAAARSAGRDPRALSSVYHLRIHVGSRPPSEPGEVTGRPEQIAERLAGFLRLGFTGLSVAFTGPDPLAELELLATEIVPAVRALR